MIKISLKCTRSFLVLLALCLLGGCGSSGNSNSYSDYNNEESSEDDYSRDNQSSQSFQGYDCLDDCSGHEAGYEWAGENDITDTSECDSNSNSFTEGCNAYLDEN